MKKSELEAIAKAQARRIALLHQLLEEWLLDWDTGSGETEEISKRTREALGK